MSLTSADIGARSEMLACAHLIKAGWLVFRNVSATGPIDLVAISEDGSITRRYDVKTGAVGTGVLTPRQVRLGVWLLLVKTDGTCDELAPPEEYVARKTESDLYKERTRALATGFARGRQARATRP